ncbi:MAG: tetratricopeptide repeat protein [Myxococcales bacterium]|nr:tetratricopeptide repeat protein [Myxococcales bacterium]MCB9546569.1 tetratricopeptide repeat protein [Myxococcales bacterium]
MKTLAQALQALAALAVLVAAVPVTLNQWAAREARQEAASRAALHASLAQEAAKAGDPALAAQAWSDALALDPGNADYRAGLLTAHVDAVLNDAGVINADPLRLHAEFADAVTRDASPPARLLVAFGRVLQYRGQGEQARARFAQAAKAQPDLADAHLYLGDAALKEGKLDEASVALGRALELDPRLTLAKFALGQVRLLQKRTDEALKLLREAAQAIPNGKVWLALGRALVDKESWVEAEKALERALGLDKTLVLAHALLAEAYVRNGKLEAAVGALRLAYERAGDLEAYRKLGRLLAGTRQPGDALAVWGEIRSLFPEDVEAHCQIGANAVGAGQLEVARAALEKCLSLGADKPDLAKMVDSARQELQRVNAMVAKLQAEQAREEQAQKGGKR